MADKRTDNPTRKVRKAWAVKIVKKHKKLTYKELVMELMGSMTVSRRTAMEFLDLALYEVKDDRRKI